MEGQQMTDQTTLRDWFAIHAPAEPWPDFKPDMPPKPEQPPLEPVGNNGEAPDEREMRQLYCWRQDPIYDVEEDLPTFSYWVGMWREYWEERANWYRAFEQARREQWPYYYADVMMRERERTET